MQVVRVLPPRTAGARKVVRVTLAAGSAACEDDRRPFVGTRCPFGANAVSLRRARANHAEYEACQTDMETVARDPPPHEVPVQRQAVASPAPT